MDDRFLHLLLLHRLLIKNLFFGYVQLNSRDDDGVLVGNWSGNYTYGVAPTSWTGSTEILLTYASSKMPVSYAQCWVYAAVFNTCKIVIYERNPAPPPSTAVKCQIPPQSYAAWGSRPGWSPTTTPPTTTTGT